MRSLLCAVSLALVLGCVRSAQRAPVNDLWYAPVPHSDITAIGIQRTSCFGRCPAFTVRFTRDDRATYVGVSFAPRIGRFAGLVDFERLAAWIDTQQPEQLEPQYAMNVIDSPHVVLTIERGAKRATVETAQESRAPLRFEGIVWAVEGVAQHVRWKAVDDLTPLVGAFAHGPLTLFVRADDRLDLHAYLRSSLCGAAGEVLVTTRARGGFRLACGARASVFHAAAGGLQASGDLVPAGHYEPISQREADRRSAIVHPPDQH